MESYRSLTVPLFDIRNIAIKHPSNRPRGKIHLVRESSDLQGQHNFNKTATWSLIFALKKLINKPNILKEIAHKLSKDIDQGVLVKL